MIQQRHPRGCLFSFAPLLQSVIFTGRPTTIPPELYCIDKITTRNIHKVMIHLTKNGPPPYALKRTGMIGFALLLFILLL